MAFPGTYDINYYKGDTFEFRIYPKDNSGNIFDLTGYLPPKFKISNVKGGKVTVTSASADGSVATYIAYNNFIVGQIVSVSGLGVASGSSLNIGSATITEASDTYFKVATTLTGISTGVGYASIGDKVEIDGYASISNNGDYIMCVITPVNGAAMVAGKQYVYDVEIDKISSPYNYVYTLLSGKISVAEQVNADAPLAVPNSPTVTTGTGLTDVTDSTYKITWTSAAVGDPATSWKVYLATNPADNNGSKNSGTVVPISTLEYNFTNLYASNAYGFGVSGINAAGEGNITWIDNYLAPNPVTSLTAGTKTSSSIQISWSAPAVEGGLAQAPLAGYYVFLGTNPVPVQTITNPATLSTTITGLTASTPYVISVSSFTSLVGTPYELLIDPDSRTSAPATITESTTA